MKRSIKRIYERLDEVQKERCYPIKKIEKALTDCGFEIIKVSGSLDGSPLVSTDERCYITARAKK